MTAPNVGAATQSPAGAFKQCRPAFVWVGGFSLLVNVLTLTSSLYMMQVYDRVLTSGSLSTLFFLTIVALGALALMSALDHVRGRILHRLSDWLERRLGPAILKRTVDAALTGRQAGADMLRDLGAVRTALTGSSFLFDAPWAPAYICFIYALHPSLGHLALLSAALLFLLAWANDRLTRDSQSAANAAGQRAFSTAEAAGRGAEAVDALHMLPGLIRRWRGHQIAGLEALEAATRRGAALLSLTRFLRQAVQVAVLGVGAWLVVRHEMTGGAMMAASIMLGRALAPVEQAIAGWRQVTLGRDALRRLEAFLARPPRRLDGLPLPAPVGRLSVRGLTFRVGDGGPLILQGVSFDAQPGEMLAIIGPSAAGKSTLARLLVGVHAPLSGSVRLDGADLFQWRRDDVARHIGYLPQDVGLFTGTVAENIARLGDVDPEAVVAAARLADCHEMILRLPNGYDTEIGDGGVFLSGGQRQRVALARALYGGPKLVALDEPNASLDSEGELALERAIVALKAYGACVIVVSHRSGTLANADRVLALRDGRVEALGPRDEVLETLKRRSPSGPPRPLQGTRPQRGPAQTGQGPFAAGLTIVPNKGGTAP